MQDTKVDTSIENETECVQGEPLAVLDCDSLILTPVIQQQIDFHVNHWLTGVQDECIENENENEKETGRLVLGAVLDGYPLALKLEMQEEIDFQHRFEKEQQVIGRIRQIAQARIEYYQQWLSLEDTESTRDDFIKTFMDWGELLKLPKIQQEVIKAATTSADFIFLFELNKSFFERIVKKIDLKVPYLVEVLYADIYNFKEFRQTLFSFPEKENCMKYMKYTSIEKSDMKYRSKMLKMLSPYMTKEFYCFFEKVGNLFFETDDEPLLNLKSVVYDEIYSSLTLALSKAKKHPEFVDVVTYLEPEVAQAEMEVYEQRKSYIAVPALQSKKMKFLVACSVAEEEISFLTKIRGIFSRLYNALRMLEMANNLFDNYTPKKSTQNTTTLVKGKPTLAAVEMVPDLDDFCSKQIMLDELENKNCMKDAFMGLKKQQLFLWHERIKQRKEQKEYNIQIEPIVVKSNNVNKDEMGSMDIQYAEQCVTIFEKMDASCTALYNSLFKSDPNCKPHNVRFQDIEKLIKSLGGKLKKDKATSHFAVSLPNTYSVWTQNNIESTLSYMDIPEVTGGSYKPHGHSGEEWTRSAHDLLKRAFIKAGITPERLVRATQVIRMKA